MKKLMMLVLVLALVIPVGQAFAAATTKSVEVTFAPMHYVLDGTTYVSPADQLGFIYNNSTYVPLRFVGSILNKSVGWNGETSKVTVAPPKSGDWASIRKYLSAQEVEASNIVPVNSTTLPLTSIDISTREISYEFDGKLVTPNPDTPGFIYKNSTYVPLRFMYESLGFDPEFDKGTYTIKASTEDPKQLSYQTIVKTNDVFIAEEIAVCTEKVSKIYRTFLFNKSTITAEEKVALTVEAEGILVDCRNNVETMLNVLSEQLTADGQSIAVVAQYKEDIDAMEKFARDLLAENQ